MNAQDAAEPDELARARRAQRRTALKQTHPDVGGSTEDFLRALASTNGPRCAPSSGVHAELVVTTSVRGRVQRVRRRTRLVSRSVRNRLPRRVPGSRRDITV